MSCNSQQMHAVESEEQVAITAMAQVPHKILVMSGKGGVGKTTVAVNLAYTFAAAGKKVGIVDADLHGPNVALMTGIEGIPIYTDKGVITPVVAAKRVKVLSIASFLPSADEPVVWRGPRKSGAIRQFLGQGDWKGTDVLIVDCPPGTGDEPMSVAQLIPDADGVVIVTSPQDVALLDSRKCVRFVQEIEHRVLGIIENLSGFSCPECGHHVDLFKTGGGERAAGKLGVPFLGRIPITPQMVESGDAGKPLVATNPEDPAAEAFSALAGALEQGWADKAAKEDADGQMEQANKKAKRRIAVAVEDDKGLAGQVSMHFGRCPYYVLAEVVNGGIVGHRIEANTHFGNHRPGQMPGFIRDLGADVILAGGMGPKAVDLFHGFGIEVATGAVGNVGNVLEAYLRGEIKGIVPCEHDHPESCGAHGPGGCGGH